MLAQSMKRPPKSKHRLAADLLARGRLQKNVAEIVGVTRQTLQVWRKDPDFQRIEEQALKDYLKAIDNDAITV